MRDVRQAAVVKARLAKRWGLVLGTLGRQGNPTTLQTLKTLLEARGLRHSVVLLSELSPAKLDMMPDVEAWIQVACPRYVSLVLIVKAAASADILKSNWQCEQLLRQAILTSM
jgi:diphthamide biosynthesis enzyme Dph1/Dph2-like protein